MRGFDEHNSRSFPADSKRAISGSPRHGAGAFGAAPRSALRFKFPPGSFASVFVDAPLEELQASTVRLVVECAFAAGARPRTAKRESP